MIDKEKLCEDLTALGIKGGDHVALGMSLGSVGMVSGGPKGFIDALIDVIGPSGTVMIPTFTHAYPLSLVRRRKVPVFRPEETVCYSGAVAEFIRRDARAIRSRHPTNSYAAIGDKAGQLLADHNHQSAAYSPYSRLADINGKVLIIGLGYKLVGIRHEAQAKAGLLSYIPPYSGALFFDDNEMVSVFVRRDPGGCTKRLPDMIEQLQAAGIVTEGSVGSAKAFVVPANEGLCIMTGLLQRNPERYLCYAARCLWCREMERRLGLCPKLSDKRWFQRNRILRFPLDAYNYVRVKNMSPMTLGRCLLPRGVEAVILPVAIRRKRQRTSR